MKKIIAITVVLMMVLAAVSSGTNSPRGGSVAKDEGFKIDVPTFDVKAKQGEIEVVTIKLHRGKFFKRDVTLDIAVDKGITIEPAKIVVKASDKSAVDLTIKVPRDAALGGYTVEVKGTPTTGEPTSVQFTVKVKAPK
jgi:uncharacterized membrane protein